MKIFIILSLMLSFQNHFCISMTTQEVPISERIEALKLKLRQKIHNNAVSEQYSDMYEYVDGEQLPLTPILETDKRKFKNRYKLPEIKTTTTEKYIPSESIEEIKPAKTNKKKKHKKSIQKPKEIFYRRNLMFHDEVERKKPQKWTHCLDLVTPYINGHKNDFTNNEITVEHGMAKRLFQLLTVNTTSYTKEEMRSILYQISNIPIRLYQWDESAVGMLMNVLIPGRKHDFDSLKRGLKALFVKWGLNVTDVNTVLDQTRIFRPPCIQVSEFAGSTLTPKGLLRFQTLKPTDRAVNAVKVAMSETEDEKEISDNNNSH